MRTARSRRAPFGAVRAMVAVLLLVLFIFGGSNATGLVPRFVGEVIGLLLLGLAIYAMDWGATIRRDGFATFLFVALILLFVAQLVPLPASIWTRLSDRQLFVNGDLLMLGEVPSRPWSLDPDATVASAMFLIPALATFLFLLSRGRAGVMDFFLAVLAFAALTLVLELTQALVRGDALHLYQNAHSTVPTGFFANRNHQGSFLVCAIPIAAALGRTRGWGRFAASRLSVSQVTGERVMLTLLCLTLTVGVLLTGSRTASALLVPAIAGAFAICESGRIRLGRFALVVVGLIVLVGLLLFVLPRLGGPLGSIFSRGVTSDEDRFAYWPAVVQAAQTYFPAGAGIGTFERAYQVHEPTAQLAPLYLNHAHNDWLELWLEGGLPGIALAALFLVWLAIRTVAVWRSGEREASFGRAGSVVVWLLLLHSLTDYPLRTIAVATVFAGGLAAMVSSRALRIERPPAPAIEKVLPGAPSSA